MIEYTKLKEKPREFLAATGIRNEEFECLLPTFEKCYQAALPKKTKPSKKKKQRAAGGGRKSNLKTMSDKLLFILVYQKTFGLQTMHGLQFGVSQGRANYWIHRLLPVLQQTMGDSGMKPERIGKQAAALIKASEGGANLSLDASERELQRPVEARQQALKYSGKKKTPTDKNLIPVNENTGKVVYLSPTVEGKKHAKKLADEAEISYPPNASLTEDTGFQGYEPDGVVCEQPKKEARKGY